MSSGKCGCAAAPTAGFDDSADLRRDYVTGFVRVADRSIPIVSTELSFRDVIGGWRVRWGIGRGSYQVPPGLYAAGSPGPESPVLVTANYKLSFDRLRQELTGIDAWILVLDTRGINVWCAAGKGTFGTQELLERIAAVKLREVVPSPRLVLPQLGGPGVSAYEVREATGFAVSFGPVRAADIPAYLAHGFRKDEAMRQVRFGLADRLALAPVELVQSVPLALILLLASALWALPLDAHFLGRVFRVALPLAGSLVIATMLFPALLPWIPFRAFSLKGLVLGLSWGIGASLAVDAGFLAGAGTTLCVAALVSFITMNFTGATTYTCLSGAELEVKRGVVPMAASLLAGVGLLVASRLLGA